MNKWIKVEDELPKLYKKIFIFGIDERAALPHRREIFVGYRNDGYFIGNYLLKLTEVTHWMPYPEEPKE